MKLSREEVKKVAKLANLPLTEEEEEKYGEQLSAVLGHIEQLNSVNTDGIIPTYNTTGLNNVFAKDEVSDSLTQEEALQNSTHTKNGLFITKGVFEES